MQLVDLLIMMPWRKHDNDGNPIARMHTNPILDTRVFEVQFSDGYVSEYATNVIAENVYATLMMMDLKLFYSMRSSTIVPIV